MAVITSGKTFANGEQLSASKLNQVITAATFASGAIDNSVMQIVGDAITVAEGGITKAKIENVANMKALGNTSGSAAAPQEVAILDENDMSSDSDTSLATQKSIKAYVDAADADPARVYNSFTNSTVSGNIQQNTTGRPLWVSFTFYTADNINFLIGEISSNSDMSSQTRIAQSRMLDTQTVDNCATQITMIVPSQWYWRFNYSSNQAAQEIVHSSFIL